MKLTVETMIDDLVKAVQGNKSPREQFLYRETLRSLVRLARAEQTLEIKSSVAKLTRGATEHVNQRKAKIDGMLRVSAATDLLQRPLEFGNDESRYSSQRAKLHGTRNNH
ncbi:MAG TPA: hypothetical protein VEC06_21325 [Paucimonas sp.]|nr:hypothetical protein [Paucimonas sp.]